MAAKKPTTKKPVVKAQAKDKKNVTDKTDPLADLGLDPVAAPAAPVAPAAAPAAPAAPAASGAAATVASNEEVDVGEIEFGFDTFIPTAKRKAEGSKYKFDQLPAPGVFEDGENKGKPKIANFKVTLQPGVDEDKLRRSVQSATTQANKQGLAAGKYFVSRSWNDKAGKFLGMIVFRTDAKPTNKAGWRASAQGLDKIRAKIEKEVYSRGYSGEPTEGRVVNKAWPRS